MDGIEKIKKRLELAEAHLHNYTDHIADCDNGTRGIWEEAITNLRHEVSVLKWVLKVLE